MKKKFKDHAKELYSAGFKVTVSKGGHQSFPLSEEQTAYLLSILGNRYYGFGLFLAFKEMYNEKFENQ